MHVMPSGPAVYCDVDTTLIEWDEPKDPDLTQYVEINGKWFYKNRHNIEYLKKFSERQHPVIVWSGSGARWAEMVVKALGLQDYVWAVMSKPTYYIDDIENPKVWIGKHRFYTLDGNAIHPY